MFDERPIIEELGTKNSVGYAPCASNTAHIDILQDDAVKMVPPITDENDTPPVEPPKPREDPHADQPPREVSPASLIAGIALLVLCVTVGSVILYSRRKNNLKERAASRLARRASSVAANTAK